MNEENLQGQAINGLKFIKLLGKGSFGVVYEVQSIKTCKKYAVKVQSRKNLHPQLHFEFDVYNYLHKLLHTKKNQNHFIPKIYGLFSNQYFTFLVMQLLGKSFEKYYKENKKFLKKQQIIRHGIQMLKLIKSLHQSQFVYRDIKPQNFLFKNQLNSTMFLVDFGLCKKISDSDQLKKIKTSKDLIGTARYASLSSHQGKPITYKDDVQSFFYMLIYFLKGHLPWQGLKNKKARNRNEQIMNLKINTTIQQLCEDLPDQIKQLGYYIKTIESYQKLDYNFVNSLLEKSIESIEREEEGLFSLHLSFEFQSQKINNKFPLNNQNKNENKIDSIVQLQQKVAETKQSILKSQSCESQQSQTVKLSSQTTRKKKPLFKRQFIIRQQKQQGQSSDESNSQNQNQEQSQNSKFMLP